MRKKYKNYILYRYPKTTIIKNNITDYDDIQEIFKILQPTAKELNPACKQHWIDRKYHEDLADKFSRIAVEKGFLTGTPKDFKYFVDNFGLNTKHPQELEYWELRGYSDKTKPTAKDMLEDYQYSVFSNNPYKKIYWTERGYSDEEADKKVSEYATKASNIGAKKKKENPEKYNHTYTTRIEYWLDKGYNEEEAKEKLRERQATFSLETCIERYGEEKGKRIFEERQRKWQETLNSKSEEELADINRAKDARSIEWAKKRFGADWKVKRDEIIKKSMSGLRASSKESKLACDKLIKYCNDENIELLYGDVDDNKKEYFIRHKNNIFFYDFTLPKQKIIIEYHGTTFHPKHGEYDWKNPFGADYETIRNKDILKSRIAKENGFTFYVLWGDEPKKNELIIESIINKLKEKEHDKS